MYFIALLISDSITLFIGYIEMIDRESNMIDKSSWLCVFNERFIHKLTDFIYTFMGRFCLEWTLYKVLWTRASTILLAILSIQRSRTFLSLAYRETRSYAFYACLFSVIFALTITCLEWTGVQYKKVENINIYLDIYDVVRKKQSSRDFYSKYLFEQHNESIKTYPCMIETFNQTLFSDLSYQSNCSSNQIASQFHELTKSLMTSRDIPTIESTINVLVNIMSNESNVSYDSILAQHSREAKASDFVIKLFEKRTCQITISYWLWLKTFNFLHSVSLSFNRHTLAIFLGNALPSFIVVLANLLSLKEICFSKSLKYLKQASRQTNRKRRFQNDLRAFFVILFESFSIIMISWGVPIFLTMYHCHTLYVVNITTCPQIKNYLALFLFTDLFNSSTNCFLYSLSGKLFRKQLCIILKAIVMCGRGVLWKVQTPASLVSNQPYDRRLSNNPSTMDNDCIDRQSIASDSYRRSDCRSLALLNHQTGSANDRQERRTSTSIKIYKLNHYSSKENSLHLFKLNHNRQSEQSLSIEAVRNTIPKSTHSALRHRSRSIKNFFYGKLLSLSSTNNTNTEQSASERSSAELTSYEHANKLKINPFQLIRSKTQPPTELSTLPPLIVINSGCSQQSNQSTKNEDALSETVVYNESNYYSIVQDDSLETMTSL